VAGLAAWRRSGDPACLAFLFTHLLRDGAWAVAIGVWMARRIGRVTGSPAHSMARAGAEPQAPRLNTSRRHEAMSTLVVIPAYNEQASLARVVHEIRRVAPGIDLLVVNDGSTDDTSDLLPRLGVRWLTLPERVGVGGAVRVGLRYAQQHGYECVVRIDGDGQHRACDVRRLVVPVLRGRADAVCGSRYARRTRLGGRHATKVALAVCLSALMRRRVTDPTSGMWAFGPRAIRLLSRHHPTGYPEPELLLLLHRNGLRIEEIPIRMRPRTAGSTSLTWARKSVALARTALAVMVVPLRRIEPEAGLDW
jgi:hypothetical protein